VRTHISPSLIILTIITSLFAASLNAQVPAFQDGPLIKGFGETAPVPTHTVSKDAKFEVAFDVANAAEIGKVNRKFDSLARFINMHAAAGVKKENIHLALIVHGTAIFDLLNNENYQQKYSADNSNLALLQALMENNVRVILCGQSAAARGLDISQLVKGTEIELSAMTAHALLQQNGYTVNPF
jgi:intracellular sulfur oxidation DsrE/DsrF family protein